MNLEKECAIHSISNQTEGWRSYIASLIAWCVGLVLILAGGLKLVGLTSAQISNANQLLAISFFILATVEILLGCCLIARFKSRVMWNLAIAFFATAAIVGIARFSIGERTCECFGPVQTPILFSVAISLVAAGLLCFFRLESVSDAALVSFRWILSASGVSIGLLGLIGCLGGDELIRPNRSSLVAVTSDSVVKINYFEGSQIPIHVTIRNQSPYYPITIVGCESISCPVSARAERVPLTVAPNETRKLNVFITRKPCPPEHRGEAVANYNEGKTSFDLCAAQSATVELITNDFEYSNARFSIQVEPSVEFLASFKQGGAIARK